MKLITAALNEILTTQRSCEGAFAIIVSSRPVRFNVPPDT